jgi:hypothetical protein
MRAEGPANANSRSAEERQERLLAVLALLLAASSILLSLTVADPSLRLSILSGFLLVLAAAEGFFGLSQLLRPRSVDRSPHTLYATQHVGLYNLFAALLLAFAALDPVGSVAIVRAVLALYVAHAGYEVACYLGLAPPVDRPFRPKRRFLVAAVTLLAVVAPVALFHP